MSSVSSNYNLYRDLLFIMFSSLYNEKYLFVGIWLGPTNSWDKSTFISGVLHIIVLV